MNTQTGVELAIKAAGNASELARLLGIKVQSIQQWRHIPAKRLLDVERVTGVPRADLRPDLFKAAA
jgi:DNA-binding transcriptional regulator YdaS (Cro superfamily)